MAASHAYRYQSARTLSVAALAVGAAAGVLALVAGISIAFRALDSRPELPLLQDMHRAFDAPDDARPGPVSPQRLHETPAPPRNPKRREA